MADACLNLIKLSCYNYIKWFLFIPSENIKYSGFLMFSGVMGTCGMKWIDADFEHMRDFVEL